RSDAFADPVFDPGRHPALSAQPPLRRLAPLALVPGFLLGPLLALSQLLKLSLQAGVLAVVEVAPRALAIWAGPAGAFGMALGAALLVNRVDPAALAAGYRCQGH